MKDYYPKLSITEYVKRYGSPNETINKSYSHKPHLAELPHDRRTNDPELLQERIDAIDEKIDELNSEKNKKERKLSSLNYYLEKNKEQQKKIEKDIHFNDTLIDRYSKEIEKLEKRAETHEVQGVDVWNRYKEGLYGGYENFTGPIENPWSSEKVKRVREEAKELDKKVQKFKDKKYSDLTEEELKEMDGVNQEVTHFMKDLYDYQGLSMEMIWFEYGDPFVQEMDIYHGINDSKRIIQQEEEEKQSSMKQLTHINSEIEKNEKEIEDINNDLEKLNRMNNDYIAEKKRTKDKLEQIIKD